MHVTRRQAALGIAGFLHVGMGFRVLVKPGPMDYDPDLAIWHEALPTWFRVAAWVTIGLVCIGASLLAPGSDRAEKTGWGLIVIMPVERALSFGWSGLMWAVPGYPPGALDSFGSMLVWAAIAMFLWIVAGIPETTGQPHTDGSK